MNRARSILRLALVASVCLLPAEAWAQSSKKNSKKAKPAAEAPAKKPAPAPEPEPAPVADEDNPPIESEFIEPELPTDATDPMEEPWSENPMDAGIAALELEGPPPSTPEIDLSGPWYYRPENLLAARPPTEGPYINIRLPAASHPWAGPGVRMEDWRQINLPGPWERQAYDFDGIFWTRVRLELPLSWEGRDLKAFLGWSDDEIEVYFNGEQIAPEREHRGNGDRWVAEIPGELVKRGANVIALRFTDVGGKAGLSAWPEGFRLVRADEKPPYSATVPLNRAWRFRIERFSSNLAEAADLPPVEDPAKNLAKATPPAKIEKEGGDPLDAVLSESAPLKIEAKPGSAANDADPTTWSRPNYDDSAWEELALPGFLDDERYDRDGSIFFRRVVNVPEDWGKRDATLELGLIADADRVYFNGTVVGETTSTTAEVPARSYRIRGELVEPGPNVIGVQVFNAQFEGGFLGPAAVMRLRHGFVDPKAVRISSSRMDSVLENVLEDVAATASNVPPPTTSAASQAAAGSPFRPRELRWKPQFREASRQPTEADRPGPHGLMYPDFRYAGVTGGIPLVPVKAQASDFGARPGDGRDDGAAILTGLAAVAKLGGGALELGPGQYELARPLLIPFDNVVLRGAGQEETRLVFRHGFERGGVSIVQPAAGGVIGPASYLEAQGFPEGLRKLTLTLEGIVIAEQTVGEDGVINSVGTHLFQVEQKLGPITRGRVILRAIAEWADGSRAESSLPAELDMSQRPLPGQLRTGPADAAIKFIGDEWTHRGKRWFLAKDAARGVRTLEFTDPPALEPGAALFLAARPTAAWLGQVESARPDLPRAMMLEVKSADRTRIELTQPVRLPFTVADGAYAELRAPIRGGGVENLTLEQERPLWTHGISFSTAWGCWVKGVRVLNAGRNPINFTAAKHCEIRDCEVTGSLFRQPVGEGRSIGAGALGWSFSWDCLMENVRCDGPARAPQFAQSAGGNVVRRSVFKGASAQWSGGWAYENLVEACEIDAGELAGVFGYGAYSQRPESKLFGPGAGPRNVLWGNVFRGSQGGLYLGGMAEAWIVGHNRFEVRSGPGVLLRAHCIDDVFVANEFRLLEPWQPAFRLVDADCQGNAFLENRVAGANRLFAGRGIPGKNDGNQLAESLEKAAAARRRELPGLEEENPDRLAPENSLYEQQKRGN
jgi:hypothetical protein